MNPLAQQDKLQSNCVHILWDIYIYISFFVYQNVIPKSDDVVSTIPY